MTASSKSDTPRTDALVSMMRDLVQGIGVLMFLIIWTAGVVVAFGWWKLLAVFFPPYGWYLLMDIALSKAGIV